MAGWYYIGPDRTGFSCSNCCAGFVKAGGSCVARGCNSDGPRSYYCPPPGFPSPYHMYTWTGAGYDDVSIEFNSYKCPDKSSTSCVSINLAGLNSAARLGSGCSQSYIEFEYNCNSEISEPCGSMCGNCTSIPIQSSILYRKCSSDCGSCVSGSFEAGICLCSCACNCCDPGSVDYPPGCSEHCVEYQDCPGDSSIAYDICTEAPPTCPCGGPAGTCMEIGCEDPCSVCVCSGGVFTCVSISCDPSCDPGYSCSCGQCVCTSESTCCVDEEAGWEWDSEESRCIPCYEPYVEGTAWPRSDCCDSTWEAKRCSGGNRCCNDGRCYGSEVFCSYPNPTF